MSDWFASVPTGRRVETGDRPKDYFGVGAEPVHKLPAGFRLHAQPTSGAERRRLADRLLEELGVRVG